MDRMIQQPMRGSYSYHSLEENEYDLENNNFTAKISRVDNNIARLYFINTEREPIPVPEHVEMVELDGNLPQIPFQNSFFVAWIGNYSIRKDGVELFRLINQKQHAVSGSKIIQKRIYLNNVLKPQN